MTELTKNLFRFYLLYIREYIEFWLIFNEIDEDGSGKICKKTDFNKIILLNIYHIFSLIQNSFSTKIDFPEFDEQVPTLKKWGVEI